MKTAALINQGLGSNGLVKGERGGGGGRSERGGRGEWGGKEGGERE